MNGSTNSTGVARAVGWLTVLSSLVYFGSDVLEAAHGGFTTLQLWLTLVAESTLPLFIFGLYRVQRSRIGRAGLYGAAAYAIAYGYFSYSVVYALVRRTPDFPTLTRILDPTMTLFGVVMVAAGVVFGAATYRARISPRWSGPSLALGVVLVAITLNLPAAVQLVAVGIRDAAFIGMGVAILHAQPNRTAVTPADRSAPSQPLVTLPVGWARDDKADHAASKGGRS